MSTDGERPKLTYERAQEAYTSGDRGAFHGLPRAPHCDGRILHHPTLDACDFCAQAIELQEERERLGISNSGHANRQWPCPADQARSKAQYSAWPGNRPKTEKQINDEAAAFAAELRRLGVIVDHE